MILSASHLLVRAIGLLLRIFLSRSLGAQALGLIELTNSAQMLLVTPVVTGLPTAVSRMCARSAEEKRPHIVRAALALSLAVSLPLCVLTFLLRLPIAAWLGDIRTLPALLLVIPCVPILGASSVLDGYYYGAERPILPALSEIIEQIIRVLLCIYLVSQFSRATVALRAAIPSAATLFGEFSSLVLMLCLSTRFLLRKGRAEKRRTVLRELLSLSLPLTAIRLVSSLMRTVNSVLIPARLEASGLPAAEALTQLGMMQGMLMPMLFLPSFIIASLSLVCAPELTRRQANARPLSGIIRKTCLAALVVGLLSMLALFSLAPLIAGQVYRQAELLPLIRKSCWLLPILSLVQMTGGMMSALGLQRPALRISLCSGFCAVMLTYWLTALPALRLQGALLAFACSHLLTLWFSMRALSCCAKTVCPRDTDTDAFPIHSV